MQAQEIKRQLQAFLSDAEIIEADDAFLLDQRRRYRGRADWVVQPASVENVQHVMRFCFEHGIAVTPQGGNTGLCGAAVPDGGLLLSLSRLNRIRSISLADNAITVDAGAVLQNVQQAAAEAGRLFPLSLASEGSCQIGGNIACNAGEVALLNDLAREFFALAFIPMLMRRHPSAAVGVGGATSLDFTLPVIQSSGGLAVVPLAISFGFIINVLAPVLMVVFSTAHF